MLKYIIFLHIGHILGFVYLRIYAAVRNYTTGFFLGTPRSRLRGIFAHKIGPCAHFYKYAFVPDLLHTVNALCLCLDFYVVRKCLCLFMLVTKDALYGKCASGPWGLFRARVAHFCFQSQSGSFMLRARVAHLCLEPEWLIFGIHERTFVH